MYLFNAAAFRTLTDYFNVKFNFPFPSGFGSNDSRCPCSGDKYSMIRNEEACLSVGIIATGISYALTPHF
jgi:hypothetical protein